MIRDQSSFQSDTQLKVARTTASCTRRLRQSRAAGLKWTNVGSSPQRHRCPDRGATRSTVMSSDPWRALAIARQPFIQPAVPPPQSRRAFVLGSIQSMVLPHLLNRSRRYPRTRFLPFASVNRIQDATRAWDGMCEETRFTRAENHNCSKACLSRCRRSFHSRSRNVSICVDEQPSWGVSQMRRHFAATSNSPGNIDRLVGLT